jgi:acetyl esterase/lipase
MFDSTYVDPELKHVTSFHINAAYPVSDADDAQQLLDTQPIPQSLDATTDLQALRTTLREKKVALIKLLDQEMNSVVEQDRQITVRDGTSITIRIYKNEKTASDARPVFIMLHGGGWILGDLLNEQPLCRKFVEEFDGIAINVDYRLAPEHIFPTAVYDCYDVLKWVCGLLYLRDQTRPLTRPDGREHD